MLLSFELPGPPYGKARHRTTRTGINYTPKETVSYEGLVKHTFRTKFPDWLPSAFTSFVMTIVAVFPIPKSVSKKKRLQMISGAIRPISRPDWDNVGKVVSDSLNKIAYRDDSQVVDGRVVKVYGEKPEVSVTFEVLD